MTRRPSPRLRHFSKMATKIAFLGASMLNAYFGPMPEASYNTAVYFKNTYRDSWITDPMSVEMIKDVDSRMWFRRASSRARFWAASHR